MSSKFANSRNVPSVVRSAVARLEYPDGIGSIRCCDPIQFQIGTESLALGGSVMIQNVAFLHLLL
jgi:hypothetical protein